jgi:outer membrane protein assembly factor BamA
VTAAVVFAGAALAAEPVAADAAGRPVEIAVAGAGWFRDRELRLALQRLLETPGKKSLDVNAIEDAAVILGSALGEEGFQQARIVVESTGMGGAATTAEFDPTFATPLPRELEARQVTFRLVPGVRFHVDEVRFSGLTALPEAEARAFFRSDATLFALTRTNAYSPSRVKRAADGLLDELRLRGYAGAVVQTATTPDTESGRVQVRVTVTEGSRWITGDLEYEFLGDASAGLPPAGTWHGRPWSPALQQDIREAVRQVYYHDGYPDVTVRVAARAGPEGPDGQGTAVMVKVVPGPRVTVGRTRFEGAVVTRPELLERRIRLQPGDPLDVVTLEATRYRISRLGIFDAVTLELVPAGPDVRDPVFRVRESPRHETNLLAGYGSYERIRAGVEHRQNNLFGRAHQIRLELVQSLKSTVGESTYSVPELFGETLDGSAKLFGLQRKEIAFQRQEFGATVALKRAVRQWGGSAVAGYTFQSLRNGSSALASRATDDAEVIVASMNLALTGDRRDNPLRPRRGYHWSAQIEVADPRFGGQTTFQRGELAGAYHSGWGRGRWLHFGFAHGVITTMGADDLGLPVNKRFFPGGDNSIRGYRRGEAAPRDAAGAFLGAKTYVQANVELEQALTPNWSAVVFGDAVGTAVALRDYPFRDRLYSVGLGIRYQTLIGPLRVEYGRNLAPRPRDPSGTWQVSIGYPF